MFERIVKNTIKSLFLIIFTIVLLINVFFSVWNYTYKKEFLIPNIVIILLTIALICLGYIIKHKTNLFKVNIHANKYILLFTLILFLLEIYIANNIYFKTDWDVEMIYNSAQAIAERNNDAVLNASQYYSWYPNNIIITLLFSFIIRIHSMFGFIQPADGYFGVIIFQCALFALTGLLLYKVIEGYTKSYKYAFLGWIFYVVLLGLSGWYVIPYSDGTGLIFPVLILYLYQNTNNQKHLPLKWAFITLLAYWGYRIKPQIVIIFIAIIILEIIKFISSSKEMKILRKNIIILGTCFIVGVVSIKIKDNLVDRSRIELNEEEKIGILHFVKMGLNEPRDGSFFPDDFYYSSSFPTVKEQNEKNIAVIKERLNNYGFFGLGNHLIKKTLVNFNDGTFAWGFEGIFFKEVKADINTSISPRLKKLYYLNGKYYKYLSTVEHIVWIAILTLLLGIYFRKENDNLLSVILLSLIGITLFETLFEARARYFIVYVPLFITGAMIGLNAIMSLELNRFEKIRFFSFRKQH